MQCFSILSKELKNRFDPFYLKNIFKNEYNYSNYKLIELGNLLKQPVQYGANEISIAGNPKKDIRYIRITDIDEFGNLKDNDWKTALNIDTKYLLKKNDLLFARSGATVGKCFIFLDDTVKSIFAGYLIRFIFNDKIVNPKYIFYYTQLNNYKHWVSSIQRPAGQPNINSEEFKSFKIPLPPLKIQDNIVSIMDSAYFQKKSKETQSLELQNSINDYILSELGIKLLNFKNKIIFSISSQEIVNNRFDVYYYQQSFYDIVNAITKCKYEKFKIHNVIKEKYIKGILPNEKEKNGKLKVLQIKNIQRNGEIIIDEYGTSVEIFREEHQIKKDEIIIVITGATIGKVGIWDFDEIFYLGGDMIKFSVNEEFNPLYVKAYLLSEVGKNQIIREITGATNKHLSPDDILKIIIPKPPIEIQNKIAQEVKSRLAQARRLKEEANKILSNAKQKIEDMILN